MLNPLNRPCWITVLGHVRSHIVHMQQLLLCLGLGILLLGIVLFSSNIFADQPEENGIGLPKHITLAATDWCPYTCDDQLNPGYITELMEAVFAQYNIDITVRFLPWQRAIASANKGHYDGLLTAIPAEAPNFHYPSIPTDSYQVCFFTQPDNYWKFYGNKKDLQVIRLGVLSGYGYGEPLDTYLADPHNANKVESISGDNPLNSMIRMLSLGRVDVIIEDKYVLRNFLQNSSRKDANDLREAGCLSSNPFYIAFSPASKHGLRLTKLIDRFLQTKDYQTLKSNVLNKYKLARNSGVSHGAHLNPDYYLVQH